ncbi:hypothetical protein MKOR_20750 [Mycolicibacillus koreensis]|nr:hypothetical protein MKOR_20750 [Mycolicibacillus koreensis]
MRVTVMSIAPSVAYSCYWTRVEDVQPESKTRRGPPPRTSLTHFRGGCELNLLATLLLRSGFHNGLVTLPASSQGIVTGADATPDAGFSAASSSATCPIGGGQVMVSSA